jgi:hypothetical protein
LNAFRQPRNDPGFNSISQNSSGNSLDKDGSKETDDSETKKDGHLADDEEEEPEWFALPVSRLDTMELLGFDDDVSTTRNGDDDSERRLLARGFYRLAAFQPRDAIFVLISSRIIEVLLKIL